MSMRIRKDDLVVVTAGKDRGKRGRVLRVLTDKGRVVVEGINMMTRHRKKNPQNTAQGGRYETEAPIHASNVMPWSDSESKGVRVKIGHEKDGRKYRASAKTGARLAAPGAATAGKKEKAEGKGAAK
jgi:large subunit ribosomal protein L24